MKVSLLWFNPRLRGNAFHRFNLGDDEQPRRLVPPTMAWIAFSKAMSLTSGLAVAKTLPQSQGL